MDRDEVLRYTAERYDTEPDYPWPDAPEYAVLRHRDTRKWYGLIMTVERDRLGLPGEGVADILNVKCDPGIVYLSKDTPGIMPAYHMNKKLWATIVLASAGGAGAEDELLPDGEIRELIDSSYNMTRKAAARKPR